MLRGEIWWVDLPDPVGSGPGYPRPALIIQSDDFNRSRIDTVIVAVITETVRLSEAPGNVLIEKRISPLSFDSVINVSQVITVDKSQLRDYQGELPGQIMKKVDEGLQLVLSLPQSSG
ncbi:MAG: type II toxin-antitoxin system PemK/MazF family toxin [Candidatus Sumerlaeota bacterium]|nr:type II toxin-antitoxin system PemK/MazF family toxin [Candidatus Sumerlaeota bacterium]